jgi:hypothetical protein
MWLSRHLNQNPYFAGFKRFVPGSFDRIPTPTTARKLAAFCGKPNIRSAFIAGDQLNGQAERRL